MDPMKSPHETASPPSPSPAIVPPLDPGFVPLVLLYRRFLRNVEDCGRVPVRIGLEREDGLLSVFEIGVPESECCEEPCIRFIERIVKFLLWSRGGWKIHMDAPPSIGDRIRRDYRREGARDFDVRIMERVYERPFAVALVAADEFPSARADRRRLGGHLDGCRIGFDLGASDYKVAAVRDGKPVFSAEYPWTPSDQADPDYHYRHVQDGLRKAAARLPRVDAIGGSSAGVFIGNQVRIASLFRSVPEALFEEKVKGMFLRLRDEWGVPLDVVNDGIVTALAGMMSLGETAVLGIAMGSSEAAGFLNASGFLPGWLDELAFAPVDANPGAPVDEWSGGRGVGANYFSQQAVDRLAPAAGIAFPDGLGLPDRLKHVQDLADAGEVRAEKIFESIGVYLGYTLPWYAVFYDFGHLLVLGRVMSGRGGSIILRKASEVLRTEFPGHSERVGLHLLDEKSRRVGQAVAAASIPELEASEGGRA
jgi:predicted NBD/HSP70 family sugar kinase